jgi:hypothetical protein
VETPKLNVQLENICYMMEVMDALIKAGLIFVVAGGLAFLGLMFVVLGFGVGGSGNPPLTGWFAAIKTAPMTKNTSQKSPMK